MLENLRRCELCSTGNKPVNGFPDSHHPILRCPEFHHCCRTSFNKTVEEEAQEAVAVRKRNHLAKAGLQLLKQPPFLVQQVTLN
ncbi:hypothetical protein NQ317_008596 [Molorchus minor]|uniref:Uncharacterized protein n=1 Tax=Molorchus minor TaxID=1323400 RepID=A0ABQ9JB19_9CUCU|nr:hypothetical protein NQ317_008596 [Molorchus minor]